MGSICPEWRASPQVLTPDTLDRDVSTWTARDTHLPQMLKMQIYGDMSSKRRQHCKKPDTHP